MSRLFLGDVVPSPEAFLLRNSSLLEGWNLHYLGDYDVHCTNAIAFQPVLDQSILIASIGVLILLSLGLLSMKVATAWSAYSSGVQAQAVDRPIPAPLCTLETTSS
jgi:hypothetical protein